MGALDFLRPAKKVPTVWWSSDDPMSTRPKLSTLVILVIGEFLFGLGDAVLIAAEIGNTPWTVLAEGIAEVIIGKQRNGPLGTIKLTFLKDFTRFEDSAMNRGYTDEEF